MAPQNHLVVSLTIIIFSICLLFPFMVSGNICLRLPVINSDLCLNTLSLPQVASAKDGVQKIIAVMNIASAEAQNMLKIIAEQTKKPTSPAALKALKSCEEDVRSASKSFGMMKPEFFNEDPQSTNYDIAVVKDYVRSCSEGLMAANVKIPEISQGIENISFFSNLGHALTRDIKG